MDTLSRAHILRKMKKTTDFLRKFADFNSTDYKKNKINKKLFEVIIIFIIYYLFTCIIIFYFIFLKNKQFFRYHSIDYRTYSNVFKLLYNVT